MSKLAKRSTSYSAPRRSGGRFAIAKAKAAGLRAAQAARNGAKRAAQNGTIVGAVGAAAFGYAEKSGMASNFGTGINPALLYGVALGFVAPMLLKGKTGELIRQAGSGVLDVAAYQLASGQSVMSGEYDNVAGEWE